MHAFITGAASGIGAATALRLARRGPVALADRDADGLIATARAVADAGGTATSHVLDVTDADAVAAALDAAEKAGGPVDALAHCAGTLVAGPVLDTAAEDWAAALAVNLTGTVHVLTAAARRMAERGAGAAVVVGSNAGNGPRVGLGAYGASKAAAHNATLTLALELAGSGVRINVVARIDGHPHADGVRRCGRRGGRDRRRSGPAPAGDPVGPHRRRRRHRRRHRLPALARCAARDRAGTHRRRRRHGMTSTETRFFPPEFAARCRAAGYWTGETFAAFLPDAAERFGGAEALAAQDVAGNPVRLSYRELDAAAAATAAGMRAAGIAAGDRVVLQLPNTAEFVTVLFGLFRLGAIPVFALPAHRRSELVHFVRTAGAKALITAATINRFDHRALAADVAAETGAESFVVDDAPFGAGAHGTPAAVDPEGLAFLQLSGGTTGVPKLIPRTHADYLYSVRESAKICGLGPGSRFLVVLPVAHNFPMSSPGILGVLWAGGTVVLGTDPAPSKAFPLIEAEKVTMTSLVPPLAMLWLQARAAGGAGASADLSSLDVLQVGGAKFPPEAARRVAPELGCRLQQVFGMAEGLVNYTRDDDPEDLVLGTQGRAISPDDEVRVLDEDGAPSRPARPGCSGPAGRTRSAATWEASTPSPSTPRASTAPATSCGSCRRGTSWWRGGRRTRSTAVARRSPPRRWRTTCSPTRW
ncbi:hypothetical protein MTP03_41480 [Tsukamurella sp. PLM1]|nr:hypothetical protein MTP03_41480 [Tsukamurella sp. PLM1]